MKKRFIVLIDFSEYSANLLKFAFDWSRQADAALLLVHQTTALVPSFADQAGREIITQRENADALQKMETLCSAVLPEAANVTFHVSESHLLTTLPKLLDEPYENLVFVGLKGTGFIRQIFIGSVAIAVIENANETVVAVPRDVSKFSPEKIFVAVSEKHPLNILALNNFLGFATKGTENITFFCMIALHENRKYIEKQLSDLAKLFGVQYETSYEIYEGNDPFDKIKMVINDKTEEMLIVQKGSRLLSDQLFRKFLINELVYEGHTPLVVLP